MSEPRAKILIVDDERNTREALAKYLRMQFDVVTADDGEMAIKELQNKNFDLVLTDLRMPGVGGMGVLEAALSKADAPICVVFTAYGSVEKAVEAVKAGAFDFMVKPVNLDQLDDVVARALRERTRTAVASPQKVQDVSQQLNFCVGRSDAMQKVLQIIEKVAPSRTTVLLTGESGTGKEVAAKALHSLSHRKGLFVPVHCAALSATLLESELFGHEKGAFTGATELRKGRFELADGGTLFLDEIGEIDQATQVKLLRVLETKSFERVGSAESLACDVRLIAATNRNLAQMVRDGEFREDLFYRLNVVNIELPPLRQRPEDIPELVARFIQEFAGENRQKAPQISPEALKLLVNYPWPGNIRELKNCLERMLVLSRNLVLTPDDVPEAIRQDKPILPAAALPMSAVPESLENTERDLILRTLAECQDNRTLAAQKLGISRRTLQRRLKTYGANND